MFGKYTRVVVVGYLNAMTARALCGANNIPSIVRDVIFPKPVEVPRGKVIFPDNKITSQVNPQNECVGNFTPQSQIFHCDK